MEQRVSVSKDRNVSNTFFTETMQIASALLWAAFSG